MIKKLRPGRKFVKQSLLGLGWNGFHRINYLEWGQNKKGDPIICVHGLTRNARDFDKLALKLSDTYRLLCPDIVGRGESDRLHDPEQYGYAQYNSDMNALIARLDVDALTWIGTSMGGIIGMILASLPKTPVKRLILNDIGPLIPRSALTTIGEYVGRAPTFTSKQDVEAYIKDVYSQFGPMTQTDWKHMVHHSSRKVSPNRWRLKYDRRIGKAYRKNIPYSDYDMWDTWDKITCPVLLIRGENSKLLTSETAHEMTKRGPKATLVTIENVGHTPTLNDAYQIGLIKDWLSQHP